MNNFYTNDELSAQVVSSIPEIALVLELGRALQMLNVDTVTLENALGLVMQHLELEGAIFATPTGFIASLRKEGYQSKTYLMRVAIGEPNLKKLTEAEALVDSVLSNQLDVYAARVRLFNIMTRRSRFNSWAKAGASGLVAMSTANILASTWPEAILSSIIGLLVGLFVNWANKQSKLFRLVPLLGGLLGALIGKLIIGVEPSANYNLIILSGIIYLLPGLELLVAIQELGTGNLISGTTRMAGAVLVFILIFFGVALGQELCVFLSHFLSINPTTALTKTTIMLAPPSWTVLLSLALSVFGYMIIFQGQFVDYGWTLAGSIVTYYISYYCTDILKAEIGAGIAALILGAACNYYAKHSHKPEAIILLPALMLILPGIMGARGLAMIMNDQTVQGLNLEFHFFSVILALMLGLLMANAVVPRRTFKQYN